MKKEMKNLNIAADDNYLKASSSQDCTGLIPSGIVYEEEIENYEELYPFLPHVISKNEK